MKKIWNWIKEKWQIVVGAFVGIFLMLRMTMNTRRQKAVLENANKSHEEEKKVNANAEKELVDGIVRINKEKDENLEEIRKNSDEDKARLEREKENLVADVVKDDDLARKLASLIGADYVEPSDD
jgi:uncharacterized membrane-anchored protein YhcB (DUF1043 family)